MGQTPNKYLSFCYHVIDKMLYPWQVERHIIQCKWFNTGFMTEFKCFTLFTFENWNGKSLRHKQALQIDNVIRIKIYKEKKIYNIYV